MHFLLGLVGLAIVSLLMAAVNDWHRKNFGVNMPSKNAMRRIRRNSRQKGITFDSAHAQWVRNKRKRTRLTQVAQTAVDPAQAEADLRAASVISRIVSKKGFVAVLGTVSIAGLIIAVNHNKDPTPPASILQQPQPPVPITIPPGRPTPVQHVEVDANGRTQPEDGYDWSDLHRISVRWIQGKISRKSGHVVASDTEGKWEPDDGYDWKNPDNLNDKSVKWVPGSPSSRYPHVVASAIEGQWRPADGYTWAVNPHRSGDMRVILANTPLDQNINASAASSFDQGVADRAEFEQWFAGLSGDFRRGANWWAGHRSLAHAGTCNGPAPAMNQQFTLGCEAAKARLTSKDVKRKSDADYRRGWNSYTGSSTPSVPELRIPTAEQSKGSEAQATDADAAKQLNENELKRILAH